MSGDDGLLKETWYMGKRWVGSFLSLQLYLAPFLKGLESESESYLEKTKESNTLLIDINPLERVIDQIQYYLYREYVQMKINLYYENFSTSYREGGLSDRAV